MIFLRFYLFFLIFFITGEVHAETTPYMFSHQYCAQGIHKLSPDGKLIARQHLLPQDKANLGIQARQYGLEILDARTLDSMFFLYRTVDDFSWSLDGKSIYVTYPGGVSQYEVTEKAFTQALTYANPWSVDLAWEPGRAQYERGIIDGLNADLGHIPYISLPVIGPVYYSDLVLASGNHQVRDSQEFHEIVGSTKKLFHSGEKKVHRWWLDSYAQPIARMSLEEKNTQGEFTVARISRLQENKEWETVLEYQLSTMGRLVNEINVDLGYELFFSFADKKFPQRKNGTWSLNRLTTDTTALYTINRENYLRQKLQYVNSSFDVDKPVITSDGELLGVQIYTETNQFIPLSNKGRKLSRHIKAVKPTGAATDVNMQSVSADGNQAIISINGNNLDAAYHVSLKSNQRRKIPLDCINTEFQTYPVWHTTADGLKILSYYSRPHSATPETPLIVEIHGGPVDRDLLSPTAQSRFFLSHGFSVLRVNYRGSSGFGNQFMAALHGNMSTDVSEDIIGSVHNIIKINQLKPRKIIAYGSSFGGYQVLNIASNKDYQVLFDSFIAHNPVTNFYDIWQEFKPMKIHYIAEHQKLETDRKNSPLIVNSISHNKPILIAWGAKDDNVNPQHARNYIEAHPKANIHSVELPNDGHYLSAEGQILFNKKIVEFLPSKNLMSKN